MITRRNMLYGIGVSMSLPWMESLHGAEPASSKRPLRLAVMHQGNGVHKTAWTCTGNGSQMKLGECLQPLESLKQHLNVYHGLYHPNARGNGIHPGQAGNILTGVRHRKGMVLGNGISFDQMIARLTGKQTMIPSLVLSSDFPTTGHHESGYSMAYSGHLSWNRTTAPVPLELYPALAFDALFDNSGNKRLMSVLDRVKEHAKRLDGQLPIADRRRLDEYLTGVRELERGLEHRREQAIKAKERGHKLASAQDFTRPAEGLPDTCREHMRQMLDIIAMAFQTDRSRVASMILTRDGSGMLYPFLNLNNIHHNYSHAWQKQEFKKITIFHVEQVAYLANKLASMPEGEGTVLDHTCLMFLSSMMHGGHDNRELPVLTVGGLGGQLKTGRTLSFAKKGKQDDHRKLSGLFLGVMQKMGVKAQRFGDAKQVLAGL